MLVAGAEEPALAEVMSELDLRAQVRACASATTTTSRSSRRSPTLGGVGDRRGIPDRRDAQHAPRRRRRRAWNELVDGVAGAHEDVRVEHLAPRVALPLAAFNASRFDVVAVARRLGGADGRDRRSARDGARRGARPARRARAEPLRAVARRRLRDSPARHRQPEQHAARRRDDARARARRAGGRATLAGAVLGGARRRAADARPAAPRLRRDDAASSRACRRRLPARLRQRRVLAGCHEHEDERRRRDAPLARGGGCRRDVRPAGRRDPAALRRDGARHDRASRPCAPRAGRRPHGRGLRARLGPRRRRRRDVRARVRRTSSRRSPTPGWTRRRSSASPARCARS